MRTIELNGNEVEAGGTVIHDSNKYMAYFTKEMGMIMTIEWFYRHVEETKQHFKDVKRLFERSRKSDFDTFG